MTSVVNLVDVDEGELRESVFQPGQGCIHHLAICGSIVAGGVEREVNIRLGHQFLKPVVG